MSIVRLTIFGSLQNKMENSDRYESTMPRLSNTVDTLRILEANNEVTTRGNLHFNVEG